MPEQVMFCDMDGVLADFVGDACKAHQRPNPYLENPMALGVFEIEKIWGITPTQFWEPCEGERFWDDLEPTPEAEPLIRLLRQKFGPSNLAICTSPSMSPYCVPGKRRWMRRYFPMLEQSMIFTSAKRFLARRGAFLLDDRDHNLDEFYEAGGETICMPRLWNKMWGQVSQPGGSLAYVREELKWIS